MNAHAISSPQIDSGRETGTVRPTHKRGLFDWISNHYADFRQWKRYRAAVRELSMMEDSRLSDIGIPRGEIRSAVRQAMKRR